MCCNSSKEYKRHALYGKVHPYTRYVMPNVFESHALGCQHMDSRQWAERCFFCEFIAVRTVHMLSMTFKQWHLARETACKLTRFHCTCPHAERCGVLQRRSRVVCCRMCSLWHSRRCRCTRACLRGHTWRSSRGRPPLCVPHYHSTGTTCSTCRSIAGGSNN